MLLVSNKPRYGGINSLPRKTGTGKKQTSRKMLCFISMKNREALKFVDRTQKHFDERKINIQSANVNVCCHGSQRVEIELYFKKPWLSRSKHRTDLYKNTFLGYSSHFLSVGRI